jgi:hypothetical protein
MVNDDLADHGEGVELSAEDFVDKRWLLAITLLLIMVSGENLIEHGRLEKKRKAKSGEGRPLEFWSPNFLGRLFQSTIAGEQEVLRRLKAAGTSIAPGCDHLVIQYLIDQVSRLEHGGPP